MNELTTAAREGPITAERLLEGLGGDVENLRRHLMSPGRDRELLRSLSPQQTRTLAVSLLEAAIDLFRAADAVEKDAPQKKKRP